MAKLTRRRAAALVVAVAAGSSCAAPSASPASAPSKDDEAGRVAPAPVKAPSAPAVDVGPDPMWRAIVDRRVFLRRASGTSPRCVALELEPELPLGGYTGDVLWGAARLRYEGRSPTLSQPRVRVGDGADLPLPCATKTVAWFVDEARCEEPGSEPDLLVEGCALPEADRLEPMISGAHRRRMMEALAGRDRLWTGARGRCLEHVVAKVKGHGAETSEAASAMIYPKSHGYPRRLTLEGQATLMIAEVAERNPHRPPRRSGDGGIALGCCAAPERFHVYAVEEDGATLTRHPRPGASPRAVEPVQWFFSAAACREQR